MSVRNMFSSICQIIFVKHFRILSQYSRIIFLGSQCGYKNEGNSSDEYVGEEYETTRELPCNTMIREGKGTIRITKEEGLSDQNSPNSMVIPVYDLYECGLDAECNENICTLLDNVKCRLVTNNVCYLDRLVILLSQCNSILIITIINIQR